MKREEILKWIPMLSFVGIIGTVVGGIYFFGGFMSTIESKGFTTPEEKVEVIQHVKQAPSPEQLQRQMILDSINTQSAIKSRALRDKLQKEQSKRDSLTAVTIYQIKEELKTLKNNN